MGHSIRSPPPNSQRIKAAEKAFLDYRKVQMRISPTATPFSLQDKKCRRDTSPPNTAGDSSSAAVPTTAVVAIADPPVDINWILLQKFCQQLESRRKKSKAKCRSQAKHRRCFSSKRQRRKRSGKQQRPQQQTQSQWAPRDAN